MITHDIMSARRVADYIAVLWKGRIVESGPATELFNSDNQFVRQFLSGEAAGPAGHGIARATLRATRACVESEDWAQREAPVAGFALESTERDDARTRGCRYMVSADRRSPASSRSAPSCRAVALVALADVRRQQRLQGHGRLPQRRPAREGQPGAGRRRQGRHGQRHRARRRRPGRGDDQGRRRLSRRSTRAPRRPSGPPRCRASRTATCRSSPARTTPTRSTTAARIGAERRTRRWTSTSSSTRSTRRPARALQQIIQGSADWYDGKRQAGATRPPSTSARRCQHRATCTRELALDKQVFERFVIDTVQDGHRARRAPRRPRGPGQRTRTRRRRRSATRTSRSTERWRCCPTRCARRTRRS